MPKQKIEKWWSDSESTEHALVIEQPKNILILPSNILWPTIVNASVNSHGFLDVLQQPVETAFCPSFSRKFRNSTSNLLQLCSSKMQTLYWIKHNYTRIGIIIMCNLQLSFYFLLVQFYAYWCRQNKVLADRKLALFGKRRTLQWLLAISY